MMRARVRLANATDDRTKYGAVVDEDENPSQDIARKVRERNFLRLNGRRSRHHDDTPAGRHFSMRESAQAFGLRADKLAHSPA